jgi:MFS family permease
MGLTGLPTVRRRTIHARAAWALGASGVFASVGYGIIAAFLTLRFAALDFAGQNFALSVFGLAFIIFLGSAYADRFGERRVLLPAFLIESAGLPACFSRRWSGSLSPRPH